MASRSDAEEYETLDASGAGVATPEAFPEYPTSAADRQIGILANQVAALKLAVENPKGKSSGGRPRPGKSQRQRNKEQKQRQASSSSHESSWTDLGPQQPRSGSRTRISQATVEVKHYEPENGGTPAESGDESNTSTGAALTEDALEQFEKQSAKLAAMAENNPQLAELLYCIARAPAKKFGIASRSASASTTRSRGTSHAPESSAEEKGHIYEKAAATPCATALLVQHATSEAASTTAPALAAQESISTGSSSAAATPAHKAASVPVAQAAVAPAPAPATKAASTNLSPGSSSAAETPVPQAASVLDGRATGTPVPAAAPQTASVLHARAAAVPAPTPKPKVAPASFSPSSSSAATTSAPKAALVPVAQAAAETPAPQAASVLDGGAAATPAPAPAPQTASVPPARAAAVPAPTPKPKAAPVPTPAPKAAPAPTPAPKAASVPAPAAAASGSWLENFFSETQRRGHNDATRLGLEGRPIFRSTFLSCMRCGMDRRE